MSGTRNQRKPRYAGPEPRVGRIESNPAPDAEDRLRRLFTLLAKHIAGNGSSTPAEDSLMPVGKEGEE